MSTFAKPFNGPTRKEKICQKCRTDQIVFYGENIKREEAKLQQREETRMEMMYFIKYVKIKFKEYPFLIKMIEYNLLMSWEARINDKKLPPISAACAHQRLINYLLEANVDSDILDIAYNMYDRFKIWMKLCMLNDKNQNR